MASPSLVMRPASSSAPSSINSVRACGERGGGRRIEPGQRARIAVARCGERQQQRREIGFADFRRRVRRKLRLLALRPQAIGDAGFEPAGAAGALRRGGLRDARRDEPRHARSTGSKRGPRARPPSMTMRMPSMVRLVSAIEVASTTLRWPFGAGAIAASCAAGGRSP